MGMERKRERERSLNVNSVCVREREFECKWGVIWVVSLSSLFKCFTPHRRLSFQLLALAIIRKRQAQGRSFGVQKKHHLHQISYQKREITVKINMGRGKIAIKRIENPTNRQVTFSKRRGGLLKKAHELAILCDAQLGVIIFSSSGKMFEYSNPSSSMRQIIERYQKASGTRIQQYDNQQVYCEMTRMKNEYDKLQASMRHFTGEDLATLTMNDLHALEQQLEISVDRVRMRKNQLLAQQLDNLRRKEHLLEEDNTRLRIVLAEHQAALDNKIMDPPMLDHFGNFYHDEQARNMLQLSPQLHAFRLQPTQPNLQEITLQRHGLQL